MEKYASTALSVGIERGVAWVTLDHPPLNLFDERLLVDLYKAGKSLAANPDARAVVVQSSDPDFFIAHADVTSIQQAPSPSEYSDQPGWFFHKVTELYRTMPKPTIGKINGIARGGGLEFLAALDMRFCSIENSKFAQPEILAGIIPGGGGCCYWPRLIGRARALELILSGADIDASIAEKYGLVNRAMPASNLDGFVERLAVRLASMPPHATSSAKRIILDEEELSDALQSETLAFLNCAQHPDARRLMRKFMSAGGQTREFELSDNWFG